MLRYNENMMASAEIFRLVLKRMTEYGFSFTPIHYAVVYEYVSGINPALSDAFDVLFQSGKPITEKCVEDIFLAYIAPEYIIPLNEHRNALTQEIQNVLEHLSLSAKATSHEAERVQKGMEYYGDSLQNTDLDQQTLKSLVDSVLKDTLSMRDSSRNLNENLNDSHKKIETLQRELRTAREEALIDPLTELLNRRGLKEKALQLLAEGELSGKEMVILMLDIDHFKNINDTHGHMVGDKAIVAVSRILKMSLRSEDMAARIGGEEFALFLPGISASIGFDIAERIRKAVERIEIMNVTNRKKIGVMTISIGIESGEFGADWEKMMDRADKALYCSKSDGRNKTTVYRESLGS